MIDYKPQHAQPGDWLDFVISLLWSYTRVGLFVAALGFIELLSKGWSW